MVLKKWSDGGTFYIQHVNFRNMICSTDVIQFTLKKPWFLPKYEDNFAGVEGLRLYGWLFLYFGRLNNGFIYPALSSDDGKKLFDKKGNGWFFVSRDKIENFDDNVKTMKRLIRHGHSVKWEREYNGSSYTLHCDVMDESPT